MNTVHCLKKCMQILKPVGLIYTNSELKDP